VIKVNVCYVRSWLSRYDSHPGLTQQSFDTVAKKVKEESTSWSYKYCCVHIDEMEIKKHLDYDRNSGKVYGFTDIGSGPLDDPSHPQATKVLAVVAVGLAGYWKLPLAYYLTDGTNATLQSTIIKDIISKLYECGCFCVSITFDGLAANLKTVELLGGSIDIDDMRSRFPHPNDPTKFVCVILDACHMIKLMRNLLNEYQVLTVPGIGKARWQHIENLHKKQKMEGLTLANRLSKRHVEYKLQKMKVRLAVQVFSSSVAQAMEYLRTVGLQEFVDSYPTERLLTVVDRLFDVLNSRSINSHGYKKAVNTNSAVQTITFLNEARAFLVSLQDSTGRPLVTTKRRTCIIGFCATIDSVIYMIENYILNPDCDLRLRYLLTYRMSQDHIETFFSVVRRRGGFNNNPTALQFMHTYRAMLSRLGVESSKNANVAVFDDEHIEAELFNAHSDVNLECENDGPVVLSNGYELTAISACKLSQFVKDVCEYIAGFVVKRLINQLKCDVCRQLLVALPDDKTGPFLELRDKGGLLKPSADVVSVVHTTEKLFRMMTACDKPGHQVSHIGRKLETEVMSAIDLSRIFVSVHRADTLNGIDDHITSLVRSIVRFYLDLRKFHLLKNWNIAVAGANVRQCMTKTVLFKNL
jgi:DNA transposase THAP9